MNEYVFFLGVGIGALLFGAFLEFVIKKEPKA
jgi:hypothetical protein